MNSLSSYILSDYAPGLIFKGSFLEIQNGRKVVMNPVFADGDGTVPMWSLETDAVTARYYLPHQPGDSSAHGDVPANKRALALVKQILIGKPPDPALYPYRPVGGLTEVEGGIISGITGTGFSVNYTLHSDAHLSITNDRGQMLGFNPAGSIEETLDGGSFLFDGEVEYASIANPSGDYHVTVTGIRDGAFSLDVDVNREGQVQSFVYPEVPVQAGTVAQVSENYDNPTGALPEMSVQTGGQGSQVAAQVRADAGTANQPPNPPPAANPTQANPASNPSPASPPPATAVTVIQVTATNPPPPTRIPPTPTATPIPPTATPSFAPGVYVLDMRTTVTEPKRNTEMGFVTRFLNTTGATQTYQWLVMIYEPGAKNAFGETGLETIIVPVGESEITSVANWAVRGGGGCLDLYARAYFRNADTSRTAFKKTDGNDPRYDFRVCP